MTNAVGQKSIVITKCSGQLRDLFDVCCELENVDRAQGFGIILSPWVEHILNSLGSDPCGNIDTLGFVQDKLNEVFPKPALNKGGYWS